MFKGQTLRVLSFLAGSLASAALQAAETAPSQTWERWIQEILKSGSSTKTPSRPDGKNLSLALPLWVDCHLSWRSDQEFKKTKSLKLPPDLVLRSDPNDCVGQPEQWAPSVASKGGDKKNVSSKKKATKGTRPLR